MKTKIAFEMMVKTLPDIVEIVTDDSIAEFKKAAKKNDTKAMMNCIIPLFATDKRDSLIRVLSAITGKDTEEINEQEFKATLLDIQDNFIGDTVTFFVLCVRMVARA